MKKDKDLISRNTYERILYERLREKEEAEQRRFERMPEYKALQKRIKVLDEEVQSCVLKRNALCKFDTIDQRRDCAIAAFIKEWNNVSLIFDEDKRQRARIALLKKHELFR